MRTDTPPASDQSIRSEPHGYLHISGPFATAHRDDIEAALWEEEIRAGRASPAARILTFDDDGTGGLLVSTTTEHLAHRLGESLRRTFGGQLHHGFRHHHRLALVWWRC